jgi:pyridoxine kinase
VAIISFQSRVAFGHVGNSAAEFALRRVGQDVWPIDTVLLSNHPGYGTWRGRTRSATELAELVEGLALLGVLPQCWAVLSGYLGSEENGGVVLAAVDRVRAARTDALYCCDPVMGDRDCGLYVDDTLVRFFRDRALSSADIVTPNHFELGVLAGAPLPSLESVVAAAHALRRRGPRIVLASSIIAAERPVECIDTLAVTETDAWLATTPWLPLPAKGTGDLLAALFLARFLETGEAADALTQAVAATFAVLERTAAEPAARELRLGAAQDALTAPPRRFPAVRLR